VKKFLTGGQVTALGTLAGGLASLFDKGNQNQPIGYTGGIPSYQATRDVVPGVFDATDRRPGSSGRQYFTDQSAAAMFTPVTDATGAQQVMGGDELAALNEYYANQQTAQEQQQADFVEAMTALTTAALTPEPEPDPLAGLNLPAADNDYTPDETAYVRGLINRGVITPQQAADYYGVPVSEVNALLQPPAPAPTPEPDPLAGLNLPAADNDYTPDETAYVLGLINQGALSPQQASDYYGVPVSEVNALLQPPAPEPEPEPDPLAGLNLPAADNDYTPDETAYVLGLINQGALSPQQASDYYGVPVNEVNALLQPPAPEPEPYYPPADNDYTQEEIDYVLGLLNSGALDPQTASAMYGVPLDEVYALMGYARGGKVTGYAQGGMMQGQGYYLGGSTDGMADQIPATINNAEPARLSDGEFVIPADVVSHLGNGNSDAGADVLYTMMGRVRKARTGRKEQGREINPNNMLPV